MRLETQVGGNSCQICYATVKNLDFILGAMECSDDNKPAVCHRINMEL